MSEPLGLPRIGDTLPERVLNFIREHNLVSHGENLLVGVSGGPDSVCLLHLLISLRDKLGVNLYLAHLNHGLRGVESEADARYVSDLAHRFDLPAIIEQREIHPGQGSLEEVAREVRYRFFAQAANSVGASKIALGHTKDDQVETILMHLLRGAGATGLRGIQPLSRWNSLVLVRPLIEVERRETEAYCLEHDLAPRCDSSNLSLSYLRNRIRHQLIPLLQSYNPNVNEVLLRTARLSAEESAFFEEQVSQVWHQLVKEEREGLILDSSKLASLHPALQRWLLRAALKRLLGDLRDIEEKHIESMRAALSWSAGKRLSLPRGLVLSTEYGRWVISADPAISCPLPALEGEYRLKVPGETLLPGWRVVATISEAKSQEVEPWSACLDFEVAGKDLVVRKRKPGDRFQPLGMSQPKKLQDFLVDAKVPQSWRDRLPLVCSAHHILWVVGWRIDERVKISENTRKILCLEFTNLHYTDAK